MKVWTRIEYIWDGDCYVIDEANSEFVEYEGQVAECKKGGGSAPAPDPAIGAAAMEEMKLGRDWLGFAKQQFNIGNKRQSQMDALTNKVTQQQIDTQNKSNARADEQWNQFKTTFQPIESKVAAEALNYDTPEKQAAAAAAAKADVMSNVQQQQGAEERRMESMGISPTSGRYRGIDRASDLTAALAGAGAENKGREQTRQMGMMLRKDAAALGRNLPGTAAQSYGVGLQAGNSAVGNQSAANASWNANNNNMSSGFSGAIGGIGSGGSLLNQQYGNQLQGWAAQQQAGAANSAGIGNMIGTLGGLGLGAYGMGLFSSKDYKEDKAPVDGALEAVDSMPIEKWKYKDGIADGGEHVGAYAEDFRAVTGLGDGKTIPIVDAIGLTMKAVQELNRKIDSKGRTKKEMA